MPVQIKSKFRASFRLFIGLLCVVAVLTFLVVQSLTPDNAASALQSGQYQRAVQLMQRPADNGNSVALTSLANLYYLGLGVEQDYEESARLYSEAAFAGNVAAQINLGHLYSNGFGLAQNTQLAYAWFNLAQDNGSLIAQQYKSELLAEHKLTFHFVQKISTQYVTVNNFPKLH